MYWYWYSIPTASVSVFAGAPRMDWFDDTSEKLRDCWVEGWDSGSAGKYDKELMNVQMRNMINITKLGLGMELARII